MLYAQDVTAFDSTEEMATACMDAVLDGYDIFDEIDDMAQVTIEDVEKVLNAMFVSTQTSASVIISIRAERNATRNKTPSCVTHN